MTVLGNIDPILTRTAVMLAKVESDYNTDASPTAADDAVQIEDPQFTTDLTVLQRNFLRNDISPLADRIGRKLAGLSFTVELRGNGSQNSGSLSDAPKLGRLLRGCGYSETAVTSTGTVGAVDNASGNTVNPTWAAGGASTKTNKADYKLSVVLGGASATAKIRVTGGEGIDDATVLKSEVFEVSVTNTTTTPTVSGSWNVTDPLAPKLTISGTFQVGDIVRVIAGGIVFTHTVVSGDTDLSGIASAIEALIDAHALITASASSAVVTLGFTGSAAGVVVTSGSTALSLGNSGGTLTPTWTGNLTLNDSWDVEVYPVGLKYQPVSSNFESLTLYFYAGGVLHKITGALGTFSVDTTAGEYGKVSFTFTGQYVDPVDALVPEDAVFETATPPIIELAKLRVDNFDAVVDKFTYDQANQVVPRPSVNDSDGYRGVRITSRAPSGGIDPEATLLSNFDFWSKLKNSTEMQFTMKVGQTAGNIVLFNAPRVQYTNLTYQNRDDLRVYDAGLKFARKNGNDEFVIHLC